MDSAAKLQTLDRAFEQIEGSVLPSLSMLLDTLLDSAAAARPGIDARVHAAEIRTLALHLEDLTRQVEAVAPSAVRVQPLERLRISA